MRFAVALFLLAATTLSGQKAELIQLRDGRQLRVSAQEPLPTGLQVETSFGPLFIAKERLATTSTKVAITQKEPVWQRHAGALIDFESDLESARHHQLRHTLETFAAFLRKHYELSDEALAGAPYRVRAYRRRADFKAAQERLAPAISRLKGRGFAEGVAGFYAPDLGEVHFWESSNESRGERAELAQHELTHLFNHLLARSMNRSPLPSWFEEGSAVYFSMVIDLETETDGDLPEPLDHPASLFEVLSDLRAKEAYGFTNLLAVPYASFYGREYSWSWALIRALRQQDGGRYWPRLLAWLRRDQPAGLGSALGVKEKQFERDWHRFLERSAPSFAKLKTTKESRLLAALRGITEPSPEQAMSFQSIARSYARVEMPELAIAYFEAAQRGGLDDAEDRLATAAFRARLDGRAEDEVWPEVAIADLDEAIHLDPLLPQARFLRGEQFALSADRARAERELGLALLLAFPEDDRESRALALLRLLAADDPQESEAKLLERLPDCGRLFEKARVYLLQEQAEFSALHQLLARRHEAGRADADEQLMLADLKMLLDQNDAAALILQDLLARDPMAHHLRPRLAEALLNSGKLEAALALQRASQEFARTAGIDLGFVLTRIAEILDRR